MKRLRKDAARKIAALPEEKVAKVLDYMDEVEARGTTVRSSGGNGGNGMRKIALRGMIGRKRDTVLLWTVIVLAFLFLALPTTLITSLNATDAAQRAETYGKWQVMASGLTMEGARELAASHGEDAAVTPVIRASGADYFQGDNEYALGVYSPELAELGSFQLREGHWPEARNEIVLEYSRLASLGLEVGDTFKVQCILEVTCPAAYSYAENQLWGLDDLTVRLTNNSASGTEKTIAGSLLYEYTVCGAIDSYSDHWDSGRTTLPSGFITEENFELLQEGREMILDCFWIGTVEDFGSLALLGGGKSASALREQTLTDYNAALPMDEQSGWLTATFYIGAQTLSEDPMYYTYIPTYGKTEISMEAYQDQVAQITFDFLLADGETGQLLSVPAWLLPGEVDPADLPEEFKEHFMLDRAPTYWSEDKLTETVAPYGFRSNPVSLENFGAPIWECDAYMFPSTNVAERMINYLFPMDLDTAVVVVDWAGERYEIPFTDFMAADFQIDGMFPASPSHAFAGTQDNFTGLRANTLAYPASAESTGTMLMIVMGILFVTTVCAVFQICFTQIRKRMRRVVLLKSLGAETKQIAGMMFWEFLYFWATALPIGTALGLGGAWLATTVLSSTQGRTVLLTIEPAVLLFALVAGTLALAIGMMIPAVMAVGVPLTGRTVRRKPMAPPKKDVRQDFFHVSLRGLAAKKGRTIGSFALCTFMMTITVLCLFLGFRFLGEYRDTVIRDGKPDYLLRSSYAMSTRQRGEYLAELEELGVCGSVTSYFVGEDIDLGGEGLEESVLFSVASGDGGSCPVDLYTLTSSDALFADFQSAATVGKLDEKAFDDGQQVLLAVPLYRTGKFNGGALASAEGWDRVVASGIETSFLPEYDGVFQRDEAVQVGDPLRLSTVTTSIREERYVTSENTAEVTVGAILYYFPDTGIWPLSGSGEGYQIVASPSLLRTVLPASGSTLQEESVRALYLRQKSLAALDGVYGATDFYINTAEDVDQETADTALLVFARNHYMDIEVYHESNTTLLRNAVSNILLACLLGMSAVLLALVIFYNTVSSDIEQERPRIGILQSLGVSNRRFAARQAAIGGVASAIAVVVANVLLWGGVLLFVCATGTVLGNLLWGYPTAWHVCLCAALACILISLFVLPMRSVGRYLPIENIRSKN